MSAPQKTVVLKVRDPRLAMFLCSNPQGGANAPAINVLTALVARHWPIIPGAEKS